MEDFPNPDSDDETEVGVRKMRKKAGGLQGASLKAATGGR